MVQTVLVLPIAISNPNIDKVGICRAPSHLARIERQANRLGKNFRGCLIARGKRTILATLRTIKAGTTADCERQIIGKESQVHIVVHFKDPLWLEVRGAVCNARLADGRGTRQEGIVVDFLSKHRRYVDIALVGKIKSKL